MQQELKSKIQFLTGNEKILNDIGSHTGYEPFAEEIVSFLDDFARCLRNDNKARQFSDIQTFAFWCRKASILKMKEEYTNLQNRKGRGVTFHVAPSNIPVMFLFSLAASLLAGNSNVVRISSKEFMQAKEACRVLNNLLESNPYIACRIVIMRYPHDEGLNEYFSQMCDSRIIWGGNRSVNEIRKFPLFPHAIDLPFYDRFSFAVINSKAYMEEKEKLKLAEKFYNDTYFTDQNACTSPQLVVWVGKDSRQAREIFWSELEKMVQKKYTFQDIQGVEKLMAASRYAICYDDGILICKNRNLCRVEIKKLHEDLKEFRCPGGYFYEYVTDNIYEIQKVCVKECQTISYFGFEREEILKVVKSCQGVDRIVPVGSTMDFGLKWDGFDFIYSLSKVIA